jgi:hypothetical protein
MRVALEIDLIVVCSSLLSSSLGPPILANRGGIVWGKECAVAIYVSLNIPLTEPMHDSIAAMTAFLRVDDPVG